jgi:hypothetical protein
LGNELKNISTTKLIQKTPHEMDAIMILASLQRTLIDFIVELEMIANTRSYSFMPHKYLSMSGIPEQSFKI